MQTRAKKGSFQGFCASKIYTNGNKIDYSRAHFSHSGTKKKLTVVDWMIFYINLLRNIMSINPLKISDEHKGFIFISAHVFCSMICLPVVFAAA